MLRMKKWNAVFAVNAVPPLVIFSEMEIQLTLLLERWIIQVLLNHPNIFGTENEFID